MRPVQDDELDIYSTEHEINEFCSNIREHEGKNIAHHHTNLDVEIHQQSHPTDVDSSVRALRTLVFVKKKNVCINSDVIIRNIPLKAGIKSQYSMNKIMYIKSNKICRKSIKARILVDTGCRISCCSGQAQYLVICYHQQLSL